jgi:hypothetical protein
MPHDESGHKSGALPEPIEVARFWKNRRHDAVVVTLQSFKGRNLVDVRMHAMNKAGALQPTPKGVAMVVLRLPDLLAAIVAIMSVESLAFGPARNPRARGKKQPRIMARWRGVYGARLLSRAVPSSQPISPAAASSYRTMLLAA